MLFDGATLNKTITMEATKGLFIFCNFENIANSPLRKIIKFQIKAVTSFSIHKIDQQEKDHKNQNYDNPDSKRNIYKSNF